MHRNPAGNFPIVEISDVEQWFADYINAFGACMRGERTPESLLSTYSMPVLLTSDEVAIHITRPETALSWLRTQADLMRVAGYHHATVLSAETKRFNKNSWLHTAHYSRRRADESELLRISVSYTLTIFDAGPRISALFVHSL